MFRNLLGLLFALVAIACFPIAQYYSKQFKKMETPKSYSQLNWQPYCVEKHKKCGYKGRYGSDTKISPTFEETYPFTLVRGNHFALVRAKGKYGYIDKKGAFILPPVYSKATSFWKNFAWVKNDETYQKINFSGRVVQQTSYDYFAPETEGPAKNIAVFGKNGHYGLLNLGSDAIIVKPIYDFIGPFSKRAVAAVKQKGQYGVIHFDGRLMIKPSFEKISFPNPDNYEKGSYSFARICRAIVKKGGKYDILNVASDSFIKNSYNFSPKYDDIKLPGKNGISKIASHNKFGYFNFDSGTILKPRFEDASEMVNNISIVKMNGKYGLMDRQGTLIIYPNMENKPSFIQKPNNYVLLKTNDKFGLLQNGTLRVKPLYDEIKCWETKNGRTDYFAVRQGQLWAVLNTYGVQTTGFEYETASCSGSSQVNVLKDGKIISLNSNGEELFSKENQTENGTGFVSPE